MIFRLINCFTVLAIFALSGHEVMSQAVRRTQTRRLGPGKTHIALGHSPSSSHEAVPTPQPAVVSSVPVADNTSVAPPTATQTKEPTVNAVPVVENPSVSAPVATQPAVEQNSSVPSAQPVIEPAIQSTLQPAVEPAVVTSAPVVEHPSVPPSAATQAAVEPTVSSTTFAPIDFEQAKTDIVRNIKRQYNILRNLTNDYRDVFIKESATANGIYKNLTKSLSWYFSEPDEQETRELDAVLSEFYPFGSKDTDYVDSMERMDNFCTLREKRLDSFKSWIRRKYRYNMVVQVALNMLVARIESKTEYYCNATAHREQYVKHMNTAKTINQLLVAPKNQLIDTAIFIQNSEYQLPKVGRLCCAFWGFFRQLLLNIKSSASVDFVVEMTRHYFSSATRYICFLYPYGSELCKDEEPSPKVPHKYESIILEGAITIGEIATP